MTSLISGPIEPDSYEFSWERQVRLQIYIVYEDFYRQKKQNPASFR